MPGLGGKTHYASLRDRPGSKGTNPWPGHTFRHKSAGAFGPDLAKKLSQLVKMEKNVMRSMELVSRERMEVAVSLAYDIMLRQLLTDTPATTFHLG